MLLKDYFEKVKGFGILSTADAGGRVNAAIYAKPRVTEDGRVAFLMRERLTWSNINENSWASYLFMEQGRPYTGIRLHLRMIGEEFDDDLISGMTREWITVEEDQALGPKHLILFRIERIRKLIGDEEPDLTWNLQ